MPKYLFKSFFLLQPGDFSCLSTTTASLSGSSRLLPFPPPLGGDVRFLMATDRATSFDSSWLGSSCSRPKNVPRSFLRHWGTCSCRSCSLRLDLGGRGGGDEDDCSVEAFSEEDDFGGGGGVRFLLARQESSCRETLFRKMLSCSSSFCFSS